MFLQSDEEAWFRSFLNKDLTVLEWGSGQSTVDIASQVKHLVSIEHDKEWFEKIKSRIPDNVTYLFYPSVTKYDGISDGTICQFIFYVIAPLLNMKKEKNYAPFDLIFIDGRARPYCSHIAPLVSHPGTLIFIHDFSVTEVFKSRENYVLAYETLEFQSIINKLALFKPKPQYLTGDLSKVLESGF